MLSEGRKETLKEESCEREGMFCQAQPEPNCLSPSTCAKGVDVTVEMIKLLE